jgi:hypothetical protein
MATTLPRIIGFYTLTMAQLALEKLPPRLQ